ncbi:MAG TPA: SGNH/GDSL hydrolase family protein [Luteibacter sp.]|jgi:thermolabile hemolysin|nr:SGNH/GDSL hydrolase family protein [Luteibacter sp.]
MKTHGRAFGIAWLASLLLTTSAYAQEFYVPGSQPSPHGPTSPVEPRTSPYTDEEIASFKGKPTYTYLRCHYRDDLSPTATTTDYEWARQSNGAWYKVNGYWWADGIFEWRNMFYSSTSQQALRDICTETLARKGIRAELAMFVAADNFLSLNYTIWTNGPAAGGASAERIVAFGDSLSDTGNIYNATQWIAPHRGSWYLGRLSNGPVWVEYLSDATTLPMYNWAITTAGADSPIPLLSLADQVSSWKTYMKEAEGYDPARTIFVMLIGGNDIVLYGNNATKIVSEQRAALESLVAAGARRILVANLPDVSKAPAFKFRNDGAKVEATVRAYNAELSAMIAQLNARPGTDIRIFDTHGFFKGLVDYPWQWGLTNASDSCLALDTNDFTNYLNNHARRSGCSPDTYVFWDNLHPTTRIHRLMAQAFRQIIPTDWLPGT